MKIVRLISLVAALIGISASLAFSQSITSGALTGVISDPSGAVISNAKVTVTNDATKSTRTVNTSGTGAYNFAFLEPGSYTLTASAAGFQSATSNVQVSVGQTSNGDIRLAVSTATTTVEVTTPPTQVDNADLSTTFGEQQIAQVPNPGNDLSAIAQTSPGAVMNTQAGFGNFSSFGLPGTSNLFTINGQNDNDPFLNLNNSGATNLLLGTNEVQEATVTNNGYSGQYGQLAGAQVNYVTKKGTNQFHGNATYFWNGRVMNANNFINNLTSTPRPFNNVNQWAASLGGPIAKGKWFFFWDYEGIRIVLPTSNAAFIPTPQFAAATLANLATANPAEIPFYQNMFNLYAGANGASRAVPQAPSADCLNISAVFSSLFPAGTPCVSEFQSTAGNFTHEYLTALTISRSGVDNDFYGRVQTDHGEQATLTDVINPLFNVQSNQPEYQGQAVWTHKLSSSQVNEFKASGQWYSAIFTNADRTTTLAAFPTNLQLADGTFSALGGSIPSVSTIATNELLPIPQGRNVTQYQVVDDFSWTRGSHTFKFGANFHRNDVTDYDPSENTTGLVTVGTLGDFFNGGNASGIIIPGTTTPLGSGTTLLQNFPVRLSQPIAVYGLAFYAQDELRATKKLRLTLALRIDHNSNPVCQTFCFSRLAAPFTNLDLTNAANVPYNQTIFTGFHQAYPATDIVVWQPRLGFAYSPLPNNKTVIRGGVGIFSDSFPASVADSLLFNPPTLGTFRVSNAATSAAIAPGVGGANNLFSLTSAANAAFLAGLASGLSFNQISATNPSFAPPNFFTSDPEVRQPRYYEWNLEVQQALGWNTVFSVNYVGNHGIYEAVLNGALNAFVATPAALSNFTALPLVAPDPALGTVTQIQSIATSNYNGLVASVRHSFSHGWAFQANYTWSHALDDVSNGGLLPFNDATNVSIINPVNPFNLRQNYGSSDYDVRQYFSANYVWDDSLRHLFHWGPNAIFGGWTISGTVFARTGLPFSVIDSSAVAALGNVPATYQLFATVTGAPFTSTSCNSGEATTSPCLSGGGFAAPGTEGGFGNQSRNSFRGPHYFDTDFTVMKYIKIKERASLGGGLQFFNFFNHPNFDQPVADVANPSFGLIQRTVNTPTSILGSFLGGDASPRLIQVKAELKF